MDDLVSDSGCSEKLSNEEKSKSPPKSVSENQASPSKVSHRSQTKSELLMRKTKMEGEISRYNSDLRKSPSNSPKRERNEETTSPLRKSFSNREKLVGQLGGRQA